jgi:hypothetical protein
MRTSRHPKCSWLKTRIAAMALFVDVRPPWLRLPGCPVRVSIICLKDPLEEWIGNLINDIELDFSQTLLDP